MKYGHVNCGTYWAIIQSDNDTAWTVIAHTFTQPNAELLVAALNDRAAIDQLHASLETGNQ